MFFPLLCSSHQNHFFVLFLLWMNLYFKWKDIILKMKFLENFLPNWTKFENEEKTNLKLFVKFLLFWALKEVVDSFKLVLVKEFLNPPPWKLQTLIQPHSSICSIITTFISSACIIWIIFSSQNFRCQINLLPFHVQVKKIRYAHFWKIFFYFFFLTYSHLSRWNDFSCVTFFVINCNSASKYRS